MKCFPDGETSMQAISYSRFLVDSLFLSCSCNCPVCDVHVDGGKWWGSANRACMWMGVRCKNVTVECIRRKQTHTHTCLFNGPLSGTTQYQKGKTNLDFTGARDSEWQWHQLGHMQVCNSLQTDYHASTPPLSFYRLDALPAVQPTASKH